MIPSRLVVAVLVAATCSFGPHAWNVRADEDRSVMGHMRAHAHNDYVHDRPLLDALDNGFRSVEADIFLVGDDLLVGHSKWELSPARTLRVLYFDPLRERMLSHPQGDQEFHSIEGDGKPMTLLIDLKSDGPSTYRVLNDLLSEYEDVFTHVTSAGIQRRGVTAIVSGNRPVAEIRSDLPRFVGIDGRLSDLESDLPADLMPLISDHWGQNFKWRGEGEMPEADRMKLADILTRAHADDRRVRFWATPDHRNVWQTLHDAGVDLINTDNLPGMNQFLKSQSK